MGHRFFNAVVIVFWLSTMSWLIVAKILPPLQIGDPPSYRSVYAVDDEGRPEPVCWDMLWNDRAMGWATTVVERTRSDVTEVKSLVHFSRVPVDEFAPAWIRPAVRRAVEPIGTLAMDADSRLEIDPLGRLSSIRSTMRAVGYPAEIVIHGKVRGTMLKGEVRSGLFVQPFERYLPPDALLGDELSPQARMPGLRIGQEWTVPVYSPLRFSDSRNPVEILHAKVEGQESVVIDDESILTMVVVYRSDSGSILAGTRQPRGKLWVADDGTVLKQMANVSGSQLTFLRAAPARAAEIVKEAEEVRERMEEARQSARRSRRSDGPPSDSPIENRETHPAPNGQSAAATGERRGDGSDLGPGRHGR